MFLVPRKPNTIFTMFFASGSKNHSIYSFWTAPSKNTGIYAVFSTLQETVFPCQRYKHTQKHGKLLANYSILAFATHPKNSKIHQQVPKIDLPNLTWQQTPFLSMLGGLLTSQKRENTTRVKEYGGGSQSDLQCCSGLQSDFKRRSDKASSDYRMG